jgi:serine/threonine protein kinase
MSLAAADRRVPGIYRLGARLDSGDTDEVYEATHPRLPGRFAIKFLGRARAAGTKILEACLNDAAQVARLAHPHTAYVLEIAGAGWGPRDGLPYIVMEHLSGQTLEAQLAGRGPIPTGQVVAYVNAIASALAAAHQVEVIHGELRPSKVFLSQAAGYPHGFPKLLDFGLWRLGLHENGQPLAPEAARYLPPELAAARFDEVNGRADQFALAAIAYRLLSGNDPFPGADMVGILRRVMQETPPSLTESVRCDPMVDAVVQRGLAKDPAQRFPTVLHFSRALEDAVASSRPIITEIVRSSDVVHVSPLAAAAAPAVEMDDEVSSSFFAEGHRQEASGLYEELAYDRHLDRIPRRRWPAFLLLFLLATACAGAAWYTGWRPPAQWQQRASALFDKLHLR